MPQQIETGTRLHSQAHQISHKNPSKSLKIFAILSTISLATLYSGYTITYIVALGTGNLKLIYGQIAPLPIFKAFLIACLPFAISLATLLSKWVLPISTPRTLTLILCLIGLFLGAIIQIQHIAVFFVVRFLQGLQVGFILVLVPRFIKQLIPLQISRNIIFGVFQKLFVLIGFALPFSFNTVLLRKNLDQNIRWRIVISVGSFPLLILLILILTKIVPESPNSLIEKQKQSEAKKVIAMYHPESDVIKVYQYKLQQISLMKNLGQVPHKKTSKLKTFLTFQIPIIHQMTGVNAYISQMGFVTAQFNKDFSEFVPLLMTCVQLLTAILSILYIRKVSPRKILLTGNLGMSLCCFAIGISVIVSEQNLNGFWSIVGFLVLFMGLNGGTFIPGIGLYVAEVGNRKSIGWSLVMNWFFCGCSIVIFVMVGDKFGYGTVFMVFGIVSLVGFVVNMFFMIETKTKLGKNAGIELKPQKMRRKGSKK